MKNLKKTKKNLLIIMLSLLVFSGCTSTFCNSKDKASMREYFIEQNYDAWYEEAITKKSIDVTDGVDVAEQEVINSYLEKKANKEIKSAERACISTKNYKTKAGYTISAKSWGDAWKKGLLEGLFVYPIAAGLGFFTELIGPSGIGQFCALLLVTILVRALMLLITFKSQKQTQLMQTIQPQLQQIQENFKNAKTPAEQQKYQQQMIKLYSEFNINPLSMLLTPFITMPVFISVWGAIKGTALIADGKLLGLSFSTKLSTQLFSGSLFAILIFVTMVVAQVISMLLPQWLRNRRNPSKKKEKNPMGGYMIFMLVIMLWTGLFLPAGMAIYWTMGAIFSACQTAIFQFIGMKKGQGKKKYEKVYR